MTKQTFKGLTVSELQEGDVITKRGAVSFTVKRDIADPMMPITPGAYYNNINELFILKRSGEWLDFSAWNGINGDKVANNPVYHPLVPVASTPKTVKAIFDQLQALAAEFGAES